MLFFVFCKLLILEYFCAMKYTFNLSLPTDWQSLSDRQLSFFFNQLARDLPIEEILTLCLFKWADLRVLCKTHNGKYLIKQKKRLKQEAQLSVLQIQNLTETLSFLRHFSTTPIRITAIGGAAAIAHDFQEVPFSTFISADNFYQGFLHTKNYELLSELTTLLYPKVDVRHINTAHLLNTFYWFTSLKQYFAKLFPHFLQPMSGEPENLLGSSPNIGEVLRHAMNTQIRALTGGDITKEQAVLAMDTWRALTELDAKAKEAEDLRRLSK